jgi:arsenate reductase
VSDKIYNVLFLCTGNSARSILGEAVMNKLGAGRFKAYSAGSQPKGEVHPMALSVLEGMGYGTTGMYSKSWSEFSKPGSPEFDFIFTVCDSAAGETCPVWIGHPRRRTGVLKTRPPSRAKDSATPSFRRCAILPTASRCS